jgi:hypothetical protein
MMLRLLSGIMLLAPALWAQFDLYLVKEAIDAPAPQVLDYGGAYPGEAATIRFRIRNTSAQAATLTALAVDGTGFSLSGAPTLPADLAPRAAMDFAVTFQAIPVGNYSAALRANGVSTLLTAAVVASLTPEIDAGGSIQRLGPIAFDAVELGASVARTIILENLTSQALLVPAISIQGPAFKLSAPSAGGLLQPRQSVRFEVRFEPPAAGTHVGVLVIGDRSYSLSGTSFSPALPKPAIIFGSGELGSGEVSIQFDAPARIAGSGVLSLDFQPLFPGAADPTIAFTSGTRAIQFTFSTGDAGVSPYRFQTGATAGVIAFTVSLGGATARDSITIPAAPIAIVSAEGLRTGSSVETRITGIDNTRTASQLRYTFFDGTGAAVAEVTADASADFARYFQNSGEGNFLLRSVFPVTGDSARIAAFELSLTNSAGTARTARTSF